MPRGDGLVELRVNGQGVAGEDGDAHAGAGDLEVLYGLTSLLTFSLEAGEALVASSGFAGAHPIAQTGTDTRTD